MQLSREFTEKFSELFFEEAAADYIKMNSGSR
jgi:hypothetical protein